VLEHVPHASAGD
jgi:hypothetical protein